MKKFFSLSLAMCVALMMFSQAPQGINYQAVARTSGGTAIAGGTISVEFKIYDGDPNSGGILLCTDVHTSVPTNQFGLFTLMIGQGSGITTFPTIAWATGNKWLKVSIDPANGSSFVVIGAQQFMSVPYALYSATSGGGPTGATGPTGPQGIPGLTGPTGPSSQISGTFGQTIYHNGTNFIATSNLFNDGTNIGIGNTSPNAKLDVLGNGIFSGTVKIGNYTLPNLDGTNGQVLSTNGSGTVTWVSGSTGTVTSVGSGAGLTGGPITTSGILSLANSGVVPGTYGSGSTIPQLTVDQYGRITNAGNLSISGLLPVASNGQTLYYNAGNWIPTSNLHNDGTKIGIGFTSPSELLHMRNGKFLHDWSHMNDGIPSIEVINWNSMTGPGYINGTNGINSIVTSDGPEPKVPLQGNAGGDNGTKYGVYGSAMGADGIKYGIYGSVNGPGTQYTYGMYGYNGTNSTANSYGGYFEDANGSSAVSYGLFSSVTANSNSAKYGLYSTVSGSGTAASKYAVFGDVTGLGTNTGIYGSASGGIFNYASYFNSGNNYMLNNLSIGGATSFSSNSLLTVKDGHVQIEWTTMPTVAPLNAAGISATTVLSSAGPRSNDVCGRVTITAGTGGMTAGAYCTVTFNKTYASTPVVILTPVNANASTAESGLGVYVTGNANGFTININGAASAGQPYIWNYMVIETQ
jgi:hypothetical protein